MRAWMNSNRRQRLVLLMCVYHSNIIVFISEIMAMENVSLGSIRDFFLAMLLIIKYCTTSTRQETKSGKKSPLITFSIVSLMALILMTIHIIIKCVCSILVVDDCYIILLGGRQPHYLY